MGQKLEEFTCFQRTLPRGKTHVPDGNSMPTQQSNAFLPHFIETFDNLTLPLLITFLLFLSCIFIVAYLAWNSYSYKTLIREAILRGRQSAYTYTGQILPPIESGEEDEIFQLVDSLGGALAQTQQRLEDQAYHLRMLYDLNEQFNQQLSLSNIIRIAIDAIWQVARVDFVAVMLGEDELGPFRYVGIRGVNDPLDILDQQYKVPLWGVLAQALVNRVGSGEGDYLIISDMAAEARPQPGEFPWDACSGSFMIIPLRHSGSTVGALLLGSLTPNYFANTDLSSYLYAVAGNTTRSIQEAQSRQQSNRWVKQLVSLQVLTRTITQSQNLDTILQSLSSELADMFGSLNVNIFLADPETKKNTLSLDLPTLTLHAHPSISPQDRQHLWSSPVMELVQWVMAAEQPLFFDPATPLADASELYYRANGRGLLVPIGEENPQGVIFISDPMRPVPFDENDMILMRTIANSAAIAIGNVRLYQELNQARNDHLRVSLVGQEV